MVSSVGRSNFTAGAATASASPSLNAQLNTCRAQLQDWVTCPSAKTPEGKAKIDQITSRMEAIRAQIEKAGQRKDNQSSAPRAMQATGQTAADPPANGGPLGSQIDVYA